jgi:hypothetical protein
VITLEDLSRRIDAMTASMHKALLEDLTAAAEYTQGELMETVRDLLNKRPTGALSRSWKITYGQRGGGIAAMILSDIVYAGIQDTGGTVYPRNGRALAIPLTQKARNRWPRDWARGDLHLIKSKSGAMLLVSVSGRGARAHMEPQYKLVSSVTIRETHYTRTAAEQSRAEVVRILGTNAVLHIERGLDGRSL